MDRKVRWRRVVSVEERKEWKERRTGVEIQRNPER
jgi:hypothetical protein